MDDTSEGESTGRKSGSSSTSARNKSKRFYCPVEGCGKDFSTSGHLARHQRIHRGDRKFVCECGRTFYRHDNLTQHRRSHRDAVFAPAAPVEEDPGLGVVAPPAEFFNPTLHFFQQTQNIHPQIPDLYQSLLQPQYAPAVNPLGSLEVVMPVASLVNDSHTQGPTNAAPPPPPTQPEAKEVSKTSLAFLLD
ncbi:hypothetical protein BCR33DRAFT_712403 [Rhizoclosmatium globosum]|uniref:C2H2-type domain-containing protein n=1 Tax=Rhizoclosmatium globosum TaxID=329046 RepID=A0A1Y2CWA6_9FUNG|nr:hypothetical protein HDU79_000515 [Rhizoclosmatium sp. JEL0117]ORY51311.1 hypothetical protein BCR33DRAFT_712403 [Rhizoclosmatium globosum]|eukprot:ORY51311.1 hypothetical protein BCR33DRAFT_712403 [Rhizoclosmatium globosum]